MKYLTLLTGSAIAIELRDVRQAQRDTEEHIRVYNNQIVKPSVLKQAHTETELDRFTGEIIQLRRKNLPRKDDQYADTIKLFKRLNLRSMINFLDSDSSTTSNLNYDHEANGPFAEAIANYGCWCLPQHGQGVGEPIDALDQICYEFNTCLQCLAYDECKSEQLTYEWQKDTDINKAYCHEQKHSCKNNLCSCEVDLAERLIAYKDTFNPLFSAMKGFDRSKYCGRHAQPLPTPAEITTSTTTTTTEEPTTTTQITTTTAEEYTFPHVVIDPFDYGQDEEEPTLVTESILAEIMAEAQEDVERAVQPDVPYKLVNGDYDMVIKAIPVKAITSEQRVMFNDQEANLIPPERSVKANLHAPIKLKSALHGIKHFKPTPIQKKCCGEYPSMKIYSPDRQTCCADGRLRSYGSC